MYDQSMTESQSIAALIGSRLCHDLVNPLGAIGNGVELLEMTGAAKGPEVDLIRDAVRDAQARVKFLRIAFGAAGPGQSISARDASAALDDLYRNARMQPDWTVQADLPRILVKLAFLMVLCAETALPMGARLSVGLDGNGQWRLTAEAAKVQMDDVLWSVLRFGSSALDRPLRPSEVQFAVLHALAEELDLTVNYVGTESGLTMSTA